ncbi:MAG TPA: diguanylate cyclase [Blastocatellia bacterium]|nr:diguanylate cyclase [Blastocatellia bacterium]
MSYTNDLKIEIPINDSKEIITARTAEQMAAQAGFSPTVINQIKTALVEACLSLAVDDTPEGKLYQHYKLDQEKLTIILSNTPTGLAQTTGVPVADDPERIWRLDVLRSLVDAVQLLRLPQGWRVELRKYISSPPEEQDVLDLSFLTEPSAETTRPAVPPVRLTPSSSKPLLNEEETDWRRFDLSFPINDDKEILAARVVERFARRAGFEPEAVNQIKTACMEACYSLTATEVPAGRIFQRFLMDEEKLVILMSNSLAGLDDTTGTRVLDDPAGQWRVDVLRSLMDMVRLTRLASGWRIELCRFIPAASGIQEALYSGFLAQPSERAAQGQEGMVPLLMKMEGQVNPVAEETGRSDPHKATHHWFAAQQTLAANTNLALLTLDGQNDWRKTAANETSICQTFLHDPAKASMCAEYCGQARQRALAAGQTITYRCEANLHCFAAPLSEAGDLVLIGGRTFLAASEYRQLLRRETAGGKRPPFKLFSNIKFTDAEEFTRHQQTILTTAHKVLGHTSSPPSQAPPLRAAPAQPAPAASRPQPNLAGEQIDLLLSNSFEQGCREVLYQLGSQFQLSSGALLMRSNGDLIACAAGGALREQLLALKLSVSSPLLQRMKKDNAAPPPLALTVRELAALLPDIASTRAEMFPLFIGEELTGLLLVLGTELTPSAQAALARLAQSWILPLEFTRMREALHDPKSASKHEQEFAHWLLSRATAPETYSAIVEKIVNQMDAERVSLLIYNEDSRQLTCQAWHGLSSISERATQTGSSLGEGIAGTVLERGEPLLVRDLREQSWVTARVHGNARSHSFISFPLLSGNKRLGVLNLTDRSNNQSFTAQDLEWLQVFAPFAAAALERIDLREKAQRLQFQTITDPLTGLLNHRHFEERFSQEIERSKRYQFPLSFVMLDIDGFKSFNDTFGHQAGDEVLRETAQCIRRSLRNFDMAARYGGEEFAVVLPETDVTSAMITAERLRTAVEHHFQREESRHPVTVSVGVSSLGKTLQNRHQVLRAAEQAMYAAKNRGKNCVVVYNTDLVPGLA